MTVAFENLDQPRAYGVVANLSRGGACVWTDAQLAVGQRLRLALSFARASRPVPADARVVWSGPVTGTSGHRCGVEWDAATPDVSHLQRMIAESA